MTLSTPALQNPASLARGKNIITIASGKGGVGKTWLAITLAHALARSGRRTLLFDGDLGLANVDLGAGLDQTVRQLTVGAGHCLVVCTDEPTSMTDAYAFLKIIRRERPEMEMPIAVNMAASRRDGENTYNVIRKVCENFLGHTPPLAGIVRRDSHVKDAIRNQTAMLTRHPDSPASVDVEALAATLGAAK